MRIRTTFMVMVALFTMSCEMRSNSGGGTCTAGTEGCACRADGCDPGLVCQDGQCLHESLDDEDTSLPPCVPQCEGKECGPDGCGGRCGFCEEGILCIDGVCDVPFDLPDLYQSDTIHDIVDDDEATTSDPCGADGLCNNTSECEGAQGDNIDPDCSSCPCNYYPGVCEAKEKNSDEACPCDYDCSGGGIACDADGHCDTWCPEMGNQSIDPDCPGCFCDYYLHICEAGEKCSAEICYCDPDCEGGVFMACMADGFCDSWCPTDEDPDCQDDPYKNGKYCP